MLADTLDRPLRFIVTAGQVGDVTQAPALLEGHAGNAVLADNAYDSNALRAIIADMKAQAVIPSNRTRTAWGVAQPKDRHSPPAPLRRHHDSGAAASVHHIIDQQPSPICKGRLRQALGERSHMR